MTKNSKATTDTHAWYHALLKRCAGLPPAPTAVVHPCDDLSIRAAVEAARLELIAPILVGPRAKIAAAAAAAKLDISHFRIEDVPHSHAAAARAVELVRAGEAAL